MKRTGKRRGKLDRHDFKGIFLNYTTTDHNIVYIDLDSGLVKTSHHAQFDVVWYLQAKWPPAVQLLFNLGVDAEVDTTPMHPSTQNHCKPTPHSISQCLHQNLMIPLGTSQPNVNSSPCHYGNQQHHQFDKRLQLRRPGLWQLPPHQQPQTLKSLPPSTQ
jgi:hypothetical protein